ncbi:hypothetical protein L873DRAFT_1813131 [Choiromyces venosus 120613-1]|uniref:Uncharacterized protein n=1 Tax=Choiromyces venosus 120613-1 TaxID=1336337 RepID=A0A3N4JAA6_9PEZI|nr:hypothetical protein L873DRAFT_1813131 [Choiromyces venosus 120613-1]
MALYLVLPIARYRGDDRSDLSKTIISPSLPTRIPRTEHIKLNELTDVPYRIPNSKPRHFTFYTGVNLYISFTVGVVLAINVCLCDSGKWRYGVIVEVWGAIPVATGTVLVKK